MGRRMSTVYYTARVYDPTIEDGKVHVQCELDMLGHYVYIPCILQDVTADEEDLSDLIAFFIEEMEQPVVITFEYFFHVEGEKPNIHIHKTQTSGSINESIIRKVKS